MWQKVMTQARFMIWVKNSTHKCRALVKIHRFNKLRWQFDDAKRIKIWKFKTKITIIHCCFSAHWQNNIFFGSQIPCWSYCLIWNYTIPSSLQWHLLWDLLSFSSNLEMLSNFSLIVSWFAAQLAKKQHNALISKHYRLDNN